MVASYAVIFTETGLSSRTSWSATFEGKTQFSITSTIAFTVVVAGSYSWSVSTPVSGGVGTQYVAASSSGAMSVSSDTSQAIAYKTQYQLTVSANPPGTGATAPAAGSYWYDSGTSLSVTATSDSGYLFDSWLSDGSAVGSFGSVNPITITMNGPHTLVAGFMTPAQATKKLINLKDSMNLPQGTANSLDAKLQAALDSINSGQNRAAQNQLSAFINEVNAQTGKKITLAQAAQLTAAANDLISALE